MRATTSKYVGAGELPLMLGNRIVFGTCFCSIILCRPDVAIRSTHYEPPSEFCEVSTSFFDIVLNFLNFRSCADEKPFVPKYQVSKERAKSLGIDFISLEESIKETVESLKEKKLFGISPVV
ncbi:hypothetical protein RJ639_042640 [Escallonia herrerae]|uniref:Uncharacterized protein n=1 Tax=Escallonia herrerae TaxID=1293975 RepID=A0AA88WFZ5_9ASTE|nr:hypothetical protein RJ639_042640 [Escallonia herrerae]